MFFHVSILPFIAIIGEKSNHFKYDWHDYLQFTIYWEINEEKINELFLLSIVLCMQSSS